MPRTLLITDPRFSWHDWLRERSGDLVCLDPANADHAAPCRAYWFSGGRVRSWRLIGSVDALRNPVGLASAAWVLSGMASSDADVLLGPLGGSVVLFQTAIALAHCLEPDRILVPEGSGLEKLGWPVGAEAVGLPAAFPAMVMEAQRRARWLEAFEEADDHEVDLSQVRIEGARLGSGTRIELRRWDGWSEVAGSVLHLVGERALDDQEASSYLNDAHAQRLSLVSGSAYKGLVCSFASQEGEDFGIGTVREFLPERGIMLVRSTAVAPAPVRILRLGTLRIDDSGRDLGDVKSWAL